MRSPSSNLPQWVDSLSQLIIMYALVVFTLETDPSLDFDTFFFASEMIVSSIFLVEYGIRLYFAKDRWAYVRSFYGITDLMASLPTLLSFGLVELQFARIFRLVRLLVIFKFIRYSKSIRIISRAFSEIKGELVIFGAATIAVVYISAVGIYFFEREVQPDKFGSIAQSLWWGLVTLTTVGYGDSFPVTVGGKVFTSLVIFVGMGVVAIPSGLLASALQDARKGVASDGSYKKE